VFRGGVSSPVRLWGVLLTLSCQPLCLTCENLACPEDKQIDLQPFILPACNLKEYDLQRQYMSHEKRKSYNNDEKPEHLLAF
jgi:hypothetical protein